MNAAAAFARENGGTTLEMTIAGRVLNAATTQKKLEIYETALGCSV